MYLFYFMCMSVLPVYMYVCTMSVSDAHGGQKKELDTLKLELWRVVSYHVGAENRTQVLCKSNKCS